VDEIQETLISIAVDQCLVLFNGYLWSKVPSQVEDGLYVAWDTTCQEWYALGALDPLTCVLLFKQPERHTKEDDNQVIATLSVHLERRPAWLRSFCDGWFGNKNQHGSISGYVLGHRLRLKYLAG
jgi:hypothetical protein